MSHFPDELRKWNPPYLSAQFQLNPSRPNPGQREKLKLNFYFHTSLRCLKRLFRNARDVKG